MSKENGNPFVVNYVKFATTRLVDEELNYHSEIGIKEAKYRAEKAGLDLVCFNEPCSNELAFCKIIDYGKWKYDTDKKKKKEKPAKSTTKEIRFSPVISDNDVAHKIKHVKEFIEDGNDVLFSMRLKGRQKAHFSEAEERMNEIVSLCSEYSKEVSRKKSPNMIFIRVSSK